MSVRFTALFLLVGLSLSCLNTGALAQQVKRVTPISKAAFVFRPIHLGNVRRPVTVEVRAQHVRHFDQDRIKSLVISVLSIRKGQRVVLSKTTLDDELYWCDVSLYRHRKSGHHLLVIGSGGHHDHTQVYYVDPQNFRVRPLFEDIGVIYGDASGLAKGRVVEHCPDQ